MRDGLEDGHSDDAQKGGVQLLRLLGAGPRNAPHSGAIALYSAWDQPGSSPKPGWAWALREACRIFGRAVHDKEKPS